LIGSAALRLAHACVNVESGCVLAGTLGQRSALGGRLETKLTTGTVIVGSADAGVSDGLAACHVGADGVGVARRANIRDSALQAVGRTGAGGGTALAAGRVNSGSHGVGAGHGHGRAKVLVRIAVRVFVADCGAIRTDAGLRVEQSLGGVGAGRQLGGRADAVADLALTHIAACGLAALTIGVCVGAGGVGAGGDGRAGARGLLTVVVAA